MRKEDKIKLIDETKIIAIIRAESKENLLSASEVIYKGGIKAIEITITTPNAFKIIEETKNKFKNEIIFGAGTVLDPETARIAILSGADYIVTPTLNIKTIKMCNRYDIPIICGSFTPTEMLTAWENGADYIKLFPANLSGPDFIKSILAPLPHLKIIAVGGVDITNISTFIKNGAVAVGIGSSLINQKILNENKMDELIKRAENFVNEVKKITSATSRRPGQ
jgi:2-dehydro-3-deoxyphosphogluconate aldolase / (4S)-4-hydroxy-2-oxoglutarate aldolase